MVVFFLFSFFAAVAAAPIVPGGYTGISDSVIVAAPNVSGGHAGTSDALGDGCGYDNSAASAVLVFVFPAAFLSYGA